MRHGAENVLDGVDALQDHHLAEVEALLRGLGLGAVGAVDRHGPGPGAGVVGPALRERLGEEHDGHAADGDDDEEALDVLLAGEHVARVAALLHRLLAEQHHVDERDQEAGGAPLRVLAVLRVGRVQRPLVEHHEGQVTEEADHEYELKLMFKSVQACFALKVVL